MLCSVCKKEFKAVFTMAQHYSKCHTTLNRVEFYCSFYKYSLETLKRDYRVLEKGLRRISRETRIPYIVLKYLTDFMGITRGRADAVRLQNDKNKTYFLSKYGVENPFQIKGVVSHIQNINSSNIKSINEKRRKTCLQRYGVDNPSKIPGVVLKLKNKDSAVLLRSSLGMIEKWKDSTQRGIFINNRNTTIKNRYGVDNVFKLPAIKDKAKETIYKKYGVYNIAYSNYKRVVMVAQGHWLPKEARSDFANYKLAVQQETRRWARVLVEDWMLFMGVCYYTREKLHLDQGRGKQPSIDHKISVLYGYQNNIPPENIGHVDNLCVCSVSINAIKNYRTEEEFYKSKHSKLTLQGLFA